MLRHFCLFADFTGADANPWAILDDGLLDKLLRTRTGQNGNVPFEALPAKASEPVRKQISAEFKSWTKSPKFVAGAPLEAVGLGGKTALMRVLDLMGQAAIWLFCWWVRARISKASMQGRDSPLCKAQ